MGLPPMPTVPQLLRSLRVSALKKLSQNFLLDTNVTDRFVRVAGSLSDAHVVEVGGGPGSLTRSILKARPLSLTVIEKDTRMLPFLEMVAEASDGRMRLVHGDALSVNYTDLMKPVLPSSGGHRVVVIGNLPFNIATPLLHKYVRMIATKSELAESGNAELVLAFQKEVAQRIVALPGDKKLRRSRVSVLAQAFCEPTYAYEIPRTAFTPCPKVDVGVVHFRKAKAELPVSYDDLEVVARTLFREPRKQISNNLRLLAENTGKDIQTVLQSIGVNPTARPQMLSGEEILRVAQLAVSSPSVMQAWSASSSTRSKHSKDDSSSGSDNSNSNDEDDSRSSSLSDSPNATTSGRRRA
eukprot:m.115116 g.115116  ORF g.115116 m.115116 type:complete len:354 (+) comp16043_c0_seq2:1397-2458(+)